MNIPLIFSNKITHRIARHLLFWLVMFCYQWLVDFIVPTFFEGVTYDTVRESGQLFLVYLAGQLILTYGLLYLVIPYLVLKSRYLLSFISLGLLCVIAGFANEVSYQCFINSSSSYFSGIHSLGMHRILGVAGFAACIKFIKYWYEKSYLNERLEKEKLTAELTALKAQVHPHFLFNTLNNIYSVAENTSPKASDMLLRLSALLRYMLYEGNKPEIPLSQELKMIQDYISLERLRYSNNLDICMETPEHTDRYYIAPLLLLPLIENCFKHGASKVTDQPWINILLKLSEDGTLHAKLINGKPGPTTSPHDSESGGIGLGNIRRRLALLYPDKHSLTIFSEEDVFIVVLTLQLQRSTSS